MLHQSGFARSPHIAIHVPTRARKSARVQVRCAGAVWLVSLLLYTGDHPRVAKLLSEIQDSLSQVREGRALGMGACLFSLHAMGRGRVLFAR